MERKTAAEYDPQLLKLYDRYVHGDIDRRQFLDDAARFAIGGLTAAALLDSLTPNYAFAQQVAADDERIATEYVSYPSPQGHEQTRAALVQPVTEEESKIPGVLVIHENRGLNPYVEDVARRVATAGFPRFSPRCADTAGRLSRHGRRRAGTATTTRPRESDARLHCSRPIPQSASCL